jgi:hypothetical protein
MLTYLIKREIIDGKIAVADCPEYVRKRRLDADESPTDILNRHRVNMLNEMDRYHKRTFTNLEMSKMIYLPAADWWLQEGNSLFPVLAPFAIYLLATPCVSSKLERHFSGVAAQQEGSKVNKDPARASSQAWAFSMLRRGDSALADATWAIKTQAKIVKMVDLVEAFARGDTSKNQDAELLEELEAFGNSISPQGGIYKQATPDEDDAKPEPEPQEGKVITVVRDATEAQDSGGSSSSASDEVVEMNIDEVPRVSTRGRICRPKRHFGDD